MVKGSYFAQMWQRKGTPGEMPSAEVFYHPPPAMQYIDTMGDIGACQLATIGGQSAIPHRVLGKKYQGRPRRERVFHPMTASSDQAERRQSFRLKLQIPLFLRGSDDSGAEFVDLTKTLDISTTGACVVTRRALQIGRVVRITIPVSSEQGSGLIPAETPPIQARVRRAGEIGETHTIGVEFLKPLE
jgi:hypothetical protein